MFGQYKIDKSMIHISVKDFTLFPGLRHCSISEKSGEEFYHTILNEAFAKAYSEDTKLIIDLDGTDGYASSFLDEAFGNLVYDFALNEVKKRVEIISMEEPHWKKMIEGNTYKQWEDRRTSMPQQPPKITEQHNKWFRLSNGGLHEEVWINQDEN